MEIRSLPVGPIGTNCYILCDETAQVCAVIDPGDEAPRVADAVKATGCVPCAILLTHGHYDHTGGVQALSALWPETPVYLSCRDQGGDNAPAQLFPLIPNAKDYGEGDALSVGGLTVEVLSTPGHSEGSVTLRCEDSLFCGDTLFAGSCGRTDFPGGSMQRDPGFPAPPGTAGGRPHSLSRPYGAHHPGHGAAGQPLPPPGHEQIRNAYETGITGP